MTAVTVYYHRTGKDTAQVVKYSVTKPSRFNTALVAWVAWSALLSLLITESPKIAFSLRISCAIDSRLYGASHWASPPTLLRNLTLLLSLRWI